MVATAKLVLREHASLESRKIGDVLRGTRVLVLDEDLIDGVVHVHLGNDTSPRVERAWGHDLRERRCKTHAIRV